MLKAAVLILPLFLVACGDAAATSAADGKTPPPSQAARPALPSAVSQPQPESTTVTGSVLETMDAGAYTYARLKTFGLRERSASLGALVGSNFNNDGTALYEAMSALFIAQLLGLFEKGFSGSVHLIGETVRSHT